MDVCVVCAVPVEAKAFLRVLEQESLGPVKQDFSVEGWQYKYATIANNAGEHLTVQVSWLPRYGSSELVQHLNPFLREFSPRFVAMTGICAGDRQKVRLGDLIVAERAFVPDAGKIIVNKEGKPEHQFDTYTAHPSSQIVQYARLFEGWKSAIASLARPVAPLHQLHGEPDCYIAPLASTSAVRADNPFAEIRIPLRGTIAIDMEGAAFYRLLEDFRNIRSLLVKGVSDYADGDKDDSYQPYAAEVSARYMLAFIKEYVNERLMPDPRKPARPQIRPSTTGARVNAPPAVSTPEEEQKPKGAVSILYIYAPEDKKICEGLEKHLSIMRRNKDIWSFGGQNIRAGRLVQEEIQRRLNEADIILLLVSPDLVGNDQLYEQLEPAWEQRARGASLLPIIVKRVDNWENTKYGGLWPLPNDPRLIPIRGKRDEALLNVAQGIRKEVEKRKKRAVSSSESE